MARLPLIHIPHGLYSVVSKCNNDEFLFNAHEKFNLYLRHLLECKKYFGFTLYDIACMSNHVHELYRVPKDITIADILQRVKGLFSRKFNKAFGRTGHFWRNKPFYRIVENERYAVNTMNYYHWNPVKAGLVQTPQEWPYSGYRFHVLGDRTGLLGELLEPINDFSIYDPKMNERVETILKRPKSRFIGSEEFRKTLRNRYKVV